MMVCVKDIVSEIEKRAPKFLMESYDNVGLDIGSMDKEVKKVLLTLDVTKKVINEAVMKNIDLIVSHHPMFFRKARNINMDSLQGQKVIELIKNNICSYSSHTNLDSAYNGVNDNFVKVLDFDSKKTYIMETNKLENTGIGRIIELNDEITFNEAIDKVKKNMNINHMRVINSGKKIKKIALINGSGQDFFSKALHEGCDLIITGDTTYHFVLDFKELGVSIIDAGHFNTEWKAFLKTMEFLKDEFKDTQFIDSEVNFDPYEFI